MTGSQAPCCAWGRRLGLGEPGTAKLERRHCADLPLEIKMSEGSWWEDLLIISEVLASTSGSGV